MNILIVIIGTVFATLASLLMRERRAWRQRHPAYLLLASALAFGGVALVVYGSLFSPWR